MKYLDKKFTVYLSNKLKECKCMTKSNKCINYLTKCKDCERIQGKYTMFEKEQK